MDPTQPKAIRSATLKTIVEELRLLKIGQAEAVATRLFERKNSGAYDDALFYNLVTKKSKSFLSTPYFDNRFSVELRERCKSGIELRFILDKVKDLVVLDATKSWLMGIAISGRPVDAPPILAKSSILDGPFFLEPREERTSLMIMDEMPEPDRTALLQFCRGECSELNVSAQTIDALMHLYPVQNRIRINR